MAEYIEREAAIIGLAASSLMPHQIDDAAEALQLVPAADVVPARHGRWARIDYEPLGHDYICSVCGGKNDRASQYCPDCGAKMDKDGDAL